MADRIPVWPDEPLLRRLVKCRVLLYQHGLLTESEMKKIDVRIDRLAAEERGDSELPATRYWKKHSQLKDVATGVPVRRADG